MGLYVSDEGFIIFFYHILRLCHGDFECYSILMH